MQDELTTLIGRLDFSSADAAELYVVADELIQAANAIRKAVGQRQAFDASVRDLLALATDAHDALEQQADVLDSYALTQEVDGVVDVDDEQEDVA